MLIDIDRKLIFIAGIKTASTSIENLFQETANIKIVRSEWGKHDSLLEIQKKYGWLFEYINYDSFFKWGIIRNPSDWLWSIYASHSDSKFSSQPNLYTGSMSFDEFLDVWCSMNSDQIIPQHKRFLGSSGQIEMDLLIPFNMLNVGLQVVAPKYGFNTFDLPRENKSPNKKASKKEKFQLEEFISEKYFEDLELFEFTQENMKILSQNIQGEYEIKLSSVQTKSSKSKRNFDLVKGYFERLLQIR